MKTRTAFALLLAALLGPAARPLLAVSRETLRIMQQLDTLQEMMQNMQKTLDTQTAVLRTLIEQSNDKLAALQAEMDDLKKSTEHDLAGNNARFDSMTSQIQSLSESLEEAKARLDKLSQQLAETQNILQTLNSPPAAAGENPAGPATPKPAPSVPDPESLYRSGVTYYTSGQYGLAIQAFQEYLKNYPDTELASNAQFYIGECYYAEKNYAQAIQEYNICLERYSTGNKLPAAQLKKGYALLALNQKVKGLRELRSLIERYPNSHEADLARQRLKKIGVAAR